MGTRKKKIPEMNCKKKKAKKSSMAKECASEWEAKRERERQRERAKRKHSEMRPEAVNESVIAANGIWISLYIEYGILITY